MEDSVDEHFGADYPGGPAPELGDGNFRTSDSWVRLETFYLMEYSEEWGSDRRYIRKDKALAAPENNCAFLIAQAAK
ncbi:MAG: hypothetical protein IMZ61_02050 [Planctomycetes bacterium]|nr:hypothetical protein [Planctomycetota bacterium]